MKSNIEVEVKLLVNEDVIYRLEKELRNLLGESKWKRQENIVFRDSEGFARFRRESGVVTFTRKGKRMRGKDYNCRSEVEFYAPARLFDEIAQIGIKGAIVYEKLRATYQRANCVVCLDNLYGKYFVEIEGAKKDIQRNIKDLCLTDLPHETKDYAQIVQEMRR